MLFYMDGASIDLEWLLSGDAVLRGLVSRDLLDEDGAMDHVPDQPRIKELVREVQQWPWPPLTSHRSAGHPFHKLAFLAELGLDLGATEAASLREMIEATMADGLPRLPTRTPERYGGSGRTEMAWALCDAPLLLYSLSRCYPSFDGRQGAASLAAMARENGMPCRVSPELGSWRGPGRKDDPCPLATLYTLRALRQLQAEEGTARVLTESLLDLWERSRERHPYMFYMGTDFRKLKLPFVWYDVLSVADTLSHCPWVHGDGRFLDMLSVIGSKRDENGRYTPESIWTSWKGWDFAQKTEPSRWVTFVVKRLHRRAGNV